MMTLNTTKIADLVIIKSKPLVRIRSSVVPFTTTKATHCLWPCGKASDGKLIGYTVTTSSQSPLPWRWHCPPFRTTGLATSSRIATLMPWWPRRPGTNSTAKGCSTRQVPNKSDVKFRHGKSLFGPNTSNVTATGIALIKFGKSALYTDFESSEKWTICPIAFFLLMR